MTLRRELSRLEDKLERVENEQGLTSPERGELVGRIVAIERKLDPELDQELARMHAGGNGAQRRRLRKRQERERREWEQWRYRRSKLPPEERGPVLEVGQRECRACGGPFWPTNARQRHCSPRCRKAAHRRNGHAHRVGQTTSPTPHG
jgi:formylmethanofuran dehydrogenase subunit E